MTTNIPWLEKKGKHVQLIVDNKPFLILGGELGNWESNPLSIELRTRPVFLQKLEYIHQNPVRAGLCRFSEKYKYSTARFYHTGIDDWGLLTHYRD